MDYKCTLTQCLILFATFHCIYGVALPRLVLQTSDGSLSQSNGDAHSNSSYSYDDLSTLDEDTYIDFDPSPSFDTNKPRFCSDCDCGVRRTTRIVGGNVTDVFEFPWVISLSNDGQYHCGGSLITRNHVLTAAHCLYSYNKNAMTITLADNNLPDRKEYIIKRRVKSVILHENYNPNTFNNDIALIELNKPVPLDGVVRTACLPEGAADYSGAMATVVGWGRTAEDHPTSDELRMVNLPILSKEECKDAGYLKSRITENMFCAGYLDGKKDSCFGDSGGPIHVHGDLDQLQVVGIISWGRGCARPFFPGVYTKLTNYLGWLKTNLEEDCICPPPHRY